MNRREALSVAILAASPGILAACGSLTSSQLNTDAEAAANAISTMAITLEGVVPTTDTVILSEIEALATAAGKDASGLASLIPSSTSTTTSDIQAIVAAITTYDGLIAQFFPASAPIIMVLNAALTIGEQLYADAGIAPPATPVAAMRMGIRAKFGTPVMPLDVARAYLKAKVHSRTSDHR